MEALVTPQFVQTMARYNTRMNERLYEAAKRIPDAERRKDRGAFWHSIHGTFNHLLWGDRMWMSRFEPAKWQKPIVAQKDSATLIDGFDQLETERKAADLMIEAWASGVDDEWLGGDLTWMSGSAGRELSMPTSFLVAHFFNHQTHHRGQAHALITACGEKTGDTDLFMVAL
jgi:uncharacterized damage-inducible protein DinB